MRKIHIAKRRLLLYIVALMACALPAVFMNSIYGYCGIVFMFFLSAASLAYGYVISNKVNCENTESTESCIRGEKVPMELELTNSSWLPTTPCHALFFTTDLAGGLRSTAETGFVLASHEKRHFGFDVSLDHVGSYSIGLRSIRCETLLGIISFETAFTVTKTVTVLPQIHELSNIHISEDVHVESNYAHHTSNADSVDYTGVRDYSFGDPIKLIHWNLSSHSGNYLTKLMESYGNNSLCIILADEVPEYGIETIMDIYDAETEIAASLCDNAKGSGLETELSFTENGQPARLSYSNSTDHAELIRILPKLSKSTSGIHLSELLKSELKRKYSTTNIVVVTSVINDEITNQISEIHARHINAILFYIQPYNVEESRETMKHLKTLSSFNIETHIIHSANEIGQEGH